MEPLVKNLMLNIMFIIFPPLLLVSIGGEKIKQFTTRTQTLILNTVGIIAVLFCMVFPVQFSSGFMFDLRHIPLIISLLILGYKKSIPLMIATLLIRFIIGGEGFYIWLIVNTTMFLMVPQVKSIYHQAALLKKVLIATSVSAFFCLMELTISKIVSSNLHLSGHFMNHFVFVEMLGMALTTIIIEYVRKNMRLQELQIKGEKLKAAGQIAAGVSHEINNPLTVTRGFLQLLSDESLSQTERNNYLSLALSELDRTKEIMENYLILANPYQGNKEQVNLKEEIQLVVESLETYANHHNVTMKVSCLHDHYLESERKKIHKLMVNIAMNAIEAMENGGLLFIEISREKRNIKMIFQDNGIGMAKEQISRLGEPFFFFNKKGTGIGLMVVYRIVQSLGGEIQIMSTLNKGTDVKITIPAAVYHNP